MSDVQIVEVLRDRWGLRGDQASYLPVGFGSHHWQVRSGRERFFVTVDDLAARRPSLDSSRDDVFASLSAALLTAQAVFVMGGDFVVAPLPARSGDVVHRLSDDYAVAVYPYVDGRVHDFDADLGPEGRSAVVALLARLHACPTPEVTRRAPVDLPKRSELVETMTQLDRHWGSGPFGDSVRMLLERDAAKIKRLLTRHDALLKSAFEPGRAVLTHGEPHPGNLLGTKNGWRLVDWDTARVGPPERDLWHLDRGDGSVEQAYTAAGGSAVRRPLLEFYRLAWALSDIAMFVAFFRDQHSDSADSQKTFLALRSTLQEVE